MKQQVKGPVRVIYIHSMMFQARCWKKAEEILDGHGIRLCFCSQTQAEEKLGSEWDICIAQLSSSQTGFRQVGQAAKRIPHRLGLSEEVPDNFTTLDTSAAMDFLACTRAISPRNYASAVLRLCRKAGFRHGDIPLEDVTVSGIWHPGHKGCFTTVQDYMKWRRRRKMPCSSVVAVIFYYGQLAEDNMADVALCTRGIEEKGLCPLPVFSPGIEEQEDEPSWVPFLEEVSGLSAIVSFMAGRLLKNTGHTSVLQALDVPVLQAIRSHSQTPEEWRGDPAGLPPITAIFSQTYPEMFGAIQPTIVAGCQHEGASQSHESRTFLPLPDRITMLCERISRHVTLRNTPARDRRITIVLHNNPCKGLEGTVGMAVGLNTFRSLGRLIRAMSKAGYHTGDAPFDGEKILAAIMDKKALSEFRWTTVDEIVRKGGALHLMGRDEYASWFDTLPEDARAKVIAHWGEFPGQGMSWSNDGGECLVITGLCYGNIRIMVQPKRGCYGAKCNGEVCRILHDPEISPPHHWLATYLYIRENSDAVIHFGTEGALEYLPGKQNGLSASCFPDISIGDLPNFYVYVMDVAGEGLVAKRRGQAILIDHMGPVLEPAVLNPEVLRLEELIEQHAQAVQAGDQARTGVLEAEIEPLLSLTGLCGNDVSCTDALETARRRIEAMKRRLSPGALHILGQTPDTEETSTLIATIVHHGASDDAPDDSHTGTCHSRKACAYEATRQKVKDILSGTAAPYGTASDRLQRLCTRISSRLSQSTLEITNLLHGLAGGYVPPGLAGSPVRCQMDVLPTGKNFYAKDVSRLPTRAAWQVGKRMADHMLRKFFRDEGRFPEQVGISIWSSDAFRSDGELLCQILHLMGTRPVWDKRKRCSRVEAIPLDELELDINGAVTSRPRIDVTIETSGIMRDMVPNFCDLMDQAAVLAAGLDEPFERNFIRKHTEEQMEELRRQTGDSLDESQVRRLATYRVFSSSPGTYGTGVGLALDASAWSSQSELAEIHINWSGQAYGSQGDSRQACGMLAAQLARLDVSYMRQTSQEYDILDSGCYATAQGSMAVAAKALSGREPRLYWSGPDDKDTITGVQEELVMSAQTRLLNRQWIRHMRAQGYRGAAAVSSRVNNLFKWSATSSAVPDALFDQVVRTYVMDRENRAWLERENPYALEEITRRLLEAASRGLWDADQALLDEVRDAALDMEGTMEEIAGDVQGEFQGGGVEVLGADQVNVWELKWRMDDHSDRGRNHREIKD